MSVSEIIRSWGLGVLTEYTVYMGFGVQDVLLHPTAWSSPFISTHCDITAVCHMPNTFSNLHVGNLARRGATKTHP